MKPPSKITAELSKPAVAVAAVVAAAVAAARVEAPAMPAVVNRNRRLHSH